MGAKMLLEKAVELKEIADALISYAKILEEKEDDENELPKDGSKKDKGLVVSLIKKKLDKY